MCLWKLEKPNFSGAHKFNFEYPKNWRMIYISFSNVWSCYTLINEFLMWSMERYTSIQKNYFKADDYFAGGVIWAFYEKKIFSMTWNWLRYNNYRIFLSKNPVNLYLLLKKLSSKFDISFSKYKMFFSQELLNWFQRHFCMLFCKRP